MHSHTFDAVNACNRAVTQFVVKTKQVDFSRKGDNSDYLLSVTKFDMHHPQTQFISDRSTKVS
jgi:hypothetical protein